MKPQIGRTYRSTKTDPMEAVTVIWITADEATLMLGHEGGMTPITRAQWDGWCDRVGAEEWIDDPPRLTHEISADALAALSALDTLDRVFNKS